MRVGDVPDARAEKYIMFMKALGFNAYEAGTINSIHNGRFRFDRIVGNDTSRSAAQPVHVAVAQGQQKQQEQPLQGQQKQQDNQQQEHQQQRGEKRKQQEQEELQLQAAAAGGARAAGADGAPGAAEACPEAKKRKKEYELLLEIKMDIIKHALQENLIGKSEDGKAFIRTELNKKCDFRSCGDFQESRTLRKVCDWALQSAKEQWEALGEDPRMNEKYGGNPLSKLRRVPTEWAHKIGVAPWRQNQKKAHNNII